MIDKIASSVVVVAAIVAAVIVEANGGESAPYLSIASLGLGYGIGHTLEKARNKK